MTRFVENKITFPYRRSLGRMLSAFMTRVDPEAHPRDPQRRATYWCRRWSGILRRAHELALDLVEVGPVGTVESFTWVPKPIPQHPLKKPFAFAFIKPRRGLDAAAARRRLGIAASLKVGARVAPRWSGKRVGHITDIACFVPGSEPEVEGADAGPASEPRHR